MLYLSKPSLDYAIAMCTTKPRYKALIVMPTIERAKFAFDDIMQALEESGCCRIVSCFSRKFAEWQNGSVLTITGAYEGARGQRTHLLIVDENVSDDMVNCVFKPMEILERIERQRQGWEDMHKPCWVPWEIGNTKEDAIDIVISEDELMKILGA